MSQKVALPAKEALQKFISSATFFKAHELKSSPQATEDDNINKVALMKCLMVFSET
jgi:hypothetical protein